MRGYKVEASDGASTVGAAGASAGSAGSAGSGVLGGVGGGGRAGAGGELFKVDLDPTGTYAAVCSFDKVGHELSLVWAMRLPLCGIGHHDRASKSAALASEALQSVVFKRFRILSAILFHLCFCSVLVWPCLLYFMVRCMIRIRARRVTPGIWDPCIVLMCRVRVSGLILPCVRLTIET